MGAKGRGRDREYLVKWVGCGEEETSWVRREDLIRGKVESVERKRSETKEKKRIEGEWEVEKIIKEKKGSKGREYLVKWLGYGEEDNSWVDGKELEGSELVREFEQSENKKTRREQKGEKEEEEYEVEKIIKEKKGNKGREYLVKWLGYGEEDNSWVDAKELEGSELARKFEQSENKKTRREQKGEKEEEEYEVEKIIKEKKGNKGREYLVKWLGYGEEDNSWVDAKELEGSELARRFEQSENKKTRREQKGEKEEEEYEVEKIIKEKKGNKGREYLVKWLGYGEEDNSWVDAKGLEGSGLAREFEQSENKKTRRGQKGEKEEEEYGVEKIIKEKKGNKGREYLVKWLGYGEEDNSWVKEGDIGAGVVREYEKERKKKKRSLKN